MSKNGLIYPRLLVEMQDGSEFEVQPLGPDQIAYELMAAKAKWPPFQQTPALWQAHLAWSALRREGLIPAGTTWESFRTGHRNVVPADLEALKAQAEADEDEEGPLDAFPTRPDPELD